MKIAVVGIPKTIDNDLQLVDKTFGFDTSVEEAQRTINAGFVEVSATRAIATLNNASRRTLPIVIMNNRHQSFAPSLVPGDSRN